MDPRSLEPVSEYALNDTEAKAFALALLWNELVSKECPNYRTGKTAIRGNPRRSSLFKYCYKLVIETKGLIRDDHYKWYILAQIRTLKRITDGSVHALIDPCALVGPKAWKRWEAWKEEFSELVARQSQRKNAQAQVPPPSYVKAEILKTKRFFVESFQATPTQDQIQRIVKENYLRKWITQNRVSPFYAIMSPFVTQSLEGRPLADLGIEADIYLPAITGEVREFFLKEFAGEFNSVGADR